MVFLWPKLGEADDYPTPAFEREFSQFARIARRVNNFCRFQSG
jgi:hypothetical protein